jgi:hypothetical protein
MSMLLIGWKSPGNVMVDQVVLLCCTDCGITALAGILRHRML